MKTWVLNIFSEHFNRILKEGKEIEARVPDLDMPQKHYHKIKKGDILLLRLVDDNQDPVKNVEPLKYEVTFNTKYDTIENLLELEGLEKVMPGVNSIEAGAKQIYSLPGYRDRMQKNGVYAIGLRKKL